MTLRRSFALTTFIVVLVCVSLGIADENKRVLIVAPTLRDPTALRLRDELAVLGFEVLVQTDSSETNLANFAHKAGASAVARIEAWPPEILLWVGDDAGHDDTLHVSQSLQGKIESEMLALRAVELLRGRLLPVPVEQEITPDAAESVESVDAGVAPVPVLSASAPPPMPSAVVLPKKTIAEKRQRPMALSKPSAYIGLGPLVAPGGLSPAVEFAFGARLLIHDRLSADAWGFLPLTANTVGNIHNEIALRPFFLGAGLDARLTPSDSVFFVSFGAGVGPMLLHFSGQTDSSTYAAASGTRWAGLAYGRIGAGIRLVPKFRVRMDGFLGPVFPEPVLRIAGREVAIFGRPVVYFTFGVEVTP